MSRAATLPDFDLRISDLDVAPPPLRNPRSRANSTLRVLGEYEEVHGPGASMYRTVDDLFSPSYTPAPHVEEGWTGYQAIQRGVPPTRPYNPPAPTYDPSLQDPYFAAYHDYAEHYGSIWQDDSKIQNRLGLPGIRFPLFIVLSLMAVGFVVAITPVLARGHTASSKKAGMSLSGYVGGPLNAQLDAQPQVPVIDATSNQQPVVPEQNPISKIQVPKSGEIVGAPSISVNQIEAVLKQYGSPAAGKGQVMYDLGVKYSIDPAYALAFFVHESGCGTKGVARFTKSLGNIRTTPGYADYQGYRSYPTWESGMEDWYKLITELYIGQWGLRTVDAIIPVYAPWGDNNNPPSYIASVKGMVNSWRGK